jgi:hypothetical protein
MPKTLSLSSLDPSEKTDALYLLAQFGTALPDRLVELLDQALDRNDSLWIKRLQRLQEHFNDARPEEFLEAA